MDDNHWPSEWQRGVLDLCVLHILADGPTYGYSIAARLTDAGFADVKGGTLYPLLKRLEGAGLVDVEWRPGEAGPKVLPHQHCRKTTPNSAHRKLAALLHHRHPTARRRITIMNYAFERAHAPHVDGGRRHSSCGTDHRSDPDSDRNHGTAPPPSG